MAGKKYDEWEKIAREEVSRVAAEEEEAKLLNDRALGLEKGPEGPPTQKAESERKEQAQQATARLDLVKKLSQIEKKIVAPASGDIDADRHGVRIVNAGAVSVSVVNSPLKVFIDDSRSTTVTLPEKMISSTVEVFRCTDVTVVMVAPVGTIQLDKAANCTLDLAHEDVVRIVHHQCENLRVKAAGRMHALPMGAVQSVSCWENGQFVTAELARDQSEFPVNYQDVVPASKALSVEMVAEKHRNEGNSAFRANDFMQAVAHYTQSLDACENDVVYCNRSQCWLKLGQHERALADAEKATALNADNVKAYFRRGIALHALARYSEAIPALLAAEKIDPSNKQITDAIRMAQLKARQAAS